MPYKDPEEGRRKERERHRRRAAEWAAGYLDEMPKEVGRNERGYALPEFNHPLA